MMQMFCGRAHPQAFHRAQCGQSHFWGSDLGTLRHFPNFSQPAGAQFCNSQHQMKLLNLKFFKSDHDTHVGE